MLINTFEEIFSVWDSIPDMADAVGESAWTVQKWRQRRRIPDKAWSSLMLALQNKGQNISADTLVLMHAKPRRIVNAACADASK